VDARGVVFDLDHTLVRSPLDLRAMAEELGRYLASHGVDLPPRQTRWSAPELARLVGERAPHLEEGFWRIALAHEHRALEAARAEPGAREALRDLGARGFRRAVWTNNGRAATEHVLGRLALGAELDLVVTRQEVRHLKPDPDGLRVIALRWPDVRQLFVVGDSWVDGQAAHAGGAPFVAYRADRAELERRGIPVWAAIEHLGELAALLG
jgi:phosphoglycolate phosphatase